MSINRNYRDLPPTVLNWLLLFNAWIVGSAAAWYCGDVEKQPKDLDVMIPPVRFHDACKLLTRYRRSGDGRMCFSSFGGLALKLEGWDVDVFPMELSEFIRIADGDKKKAVGLRPYRVVQW